MDEHELRSGDAVFRCDDDLRIAEWNEGAEKLTGVAAEDAVDRHCWDVIAGHDEHGGLVCHPGCSIARLARQGFPVSCTNLLVRTPRGERRITISTIVLRNGRGSLILHPMRETPVEPAQRPRSETARPPGLTPRQLEILTLLAGGVRVREIAQRLSLSETTVRNHVRAVLSELGAHSQLEAVARARDLSLLEA